MASPYPSDQEEYAFWQREKAAADLSNEELFGHAGSDWQPAHLLTDAEKAEDERMEAAKKKAKK